MKALTKEEDRFERVEMLIGVATKALRIKFDEFHPPDTLQETLLRCKTDIMPHINQNQEKILYREIDTVSSCKMDIILMVCVLRNTGFPEPHSSFDCMPYEHDINDGADVARIKFYRNKVKHLKDKELNDQEFQEISHTLIEVIRRFSDLLFEDETKRIMEGSLDTRAGSIIWHVNQPIMALANNLYQQQPLHYLIYVGIVLACGMKIVFENL